MPTALKPVNTKHLGGRPTKFHTKLLPHVRKLAKIAATEIEIADCMGIDPTTFTDWKARYPMFSRALELGKAQADKRIERSLFHRAAGYQHTTEKAFNDKGNIIKTTIRESLPPDTNAAIFWLKNRKPEAWQDRSVVDGSISLNVGELVAKGRQRVLAAKAQAPILDADTID